MSKVRWIRVTKLTAVLAACLICYSSTLPAQTPHSDSLAHIISQLPDKQSKVDFINQHCESIMNEDYELGYELAHQAYDLANQLDYPEGSAYSLKDMGTYHWYNGYYDQAIQQFKQALQIGKGIVTKKMMAETYNKIGLVYYYQASYDSAQKYHLKSQGYFNNMGDSLGVAMIWYHLGLLNFYQSKYDQAVDYYLRSLRLYELHGTPLNQANLLNKISEVYQALGQIELIWEKQDELLELANAESEKSNMAKFNDQIGDIYFLTNSYDSALNYFSKAMAGYEEMGQTNSYDFVTEKIGKIYLSKGENETALKYFQRVQQIREERGTRIHKSSNAGYLGDTYLAMGDYEKAIENYSKALDLHLAMGNAISLSTMYASIAEAYCKSGSYDKALENGLLGLSVSNKISAKNSEVENLRVLSSAYIKKGLFEKAYHFLDEYHQKKETLSRSNALQRITNLKVQFNEAKNAQKIAQLKQTEVQQKASIQQRNYLIIIFFTLFIFILSVSFLLYKQYHLKARNNELLAKRNKEIELDNLLLNKKNKEGELLLAEIRHRIKNNLQTISSLLNMHSRQLSPRQQSLMQESHNRVRAMALIHQMLHKETQFAYIELSSYIEELAQNLIISYGLSHVKLNLNIAPLYVEADSGVYIGLIVNELVTNSLKHAFGENSKGQLWIQGKKLGNNDLELSIKDNGHGFAKKSREPDSFGIKLISVLIEELDGEFIYQEKMGTEAVVSLKCAILEQPAQYVEAPELKV